MKFITAAVAAVALIGAGSAMAGKLQDDGCLSCHNGKLAPSFKDVNAVIKGDAAIVKATLEKGAKTGKYTGVVMKMMPPQASHVGDAAELAKEIAAQK